MTARKSIEIICSSCRADSLIRREPVYEGFTKTGERLLCAACGHEYETEEEVPFKEAADTVIFTDADRSEEVKVFEAGEARICRRCQHYVVNPFTQWCHVQKKEVQATDGCERFALNAEADKDE